MSATGQSPIDGMHLAARLRQRDGVLPSGHRLHHTLDQIERQQRRIAGRRYDPARVGGIAADQRMPASTPASGPTNPSTVSATTGRAKAANRCGSPLALMTIVRPAAPADR